jgi:hypothetical protein
MEKKKERDGRERKKDTQHRIKQEYNAVFDVLIQ